MNNMRVVRDKKRKPSHKLYRHKDVNAGEASFAAGLNGYKSVWVFIICSAIGVGLETLCVFLGQGIWRRCSGMLYGPFNQIYGLGAALFTWVLCRFRGHGGKVIFAVSALIGGVFEYMCSFVQQAVFGSVSWEYSNIPTNIGGRTNLLYMAGWGLVGLWFITYFWPFLSEMIERIPNRITLHSKTWAKAIHVTGKGLTIACVIALAINLTVTAFAVWRTGERSLGQPAVNVVAEWVDETYPDEVMRARFPTMEYVHYAEAG